MVALSCVHPDVRMIEVSWLALTVSEKMTYMQKLNKSLCNEFGKQEFGIDIRNAIHMSHFCFAGVTNTRPVGI